jgi:CheY-like chemotaxis protein/two-component sensor histidine kinase
MAFSRQTELQKQPLKPKFIIREALKLLRASLPATIEIRNTVISDASIMADPMQIHQIMMNLCTNAGHAMKEEGGTLEVRLEDIDVDEAFALQHPGIRPGRHLLWRVLDSGNGISPQIVDRIFDPFFTTKPQGEGTGLGLSVVHGIVKALDGIVTVSSELGKGTIFSIYLPVVEVMAKEIEPMNHEEICGGTERVLLVDDEESIVRTGTQILEELGYQVVGFTQSTFALEKFLSDPFSFDAVITDCTMPSITGYALSKKIREIRADIPIIMCSGNLDKCTALKTQNTGINAFLKKPSPMRDLAMTLRRVIDGFEVLD